MSDKNVKLLAFRSARLAGKGDRNPAMIRARSVMLATAKINQSNASTPRLAHRD